VLDRPIVIHAPDWDEYRARRGVYFDLLAEPPGPVARTQDEVVAALAAPESGTRPAFRERFCALEDGHAAERVVRRVWGLA
jgi:CDP-glycerol glycerophosphotransferase